MKRFTLIVLIQLLLVPSWSFGQFGLGKLKKALDKVQKISELQLTDEDEMALGKEVSQRLRETFGVQQDEAPTRYVSLVGQTLVEKSDRPNLDYHFIILDTGGINAFAAPGGYIHITRGALAVIKNEAELAGVLGHEIGHVTAKHTLEELQKMKGLQLAEGETSLSGNSEIMQQVADRMTDALIKGFGRKQELEADEIGAKIASAVGYDPNGLGGFLESLSAANEDNNERQGLFASHPETKERIERLHKQIASNGLAEGPKGILEARYRDNIKYEFNPADLTELAEGAKGVAGGSGKSGQKDSEEPPKKKSRFSLARLTNPGGGGEKKETAEVTSAGASKGAGGKAEAESGPKNPAVIEVKISKADLEKFKQEGKLKTS